MSGVCDMADALSGCQGSLNIVYVLTRYQGAWTLLMYSQGWCWDVEDI